MITIEQAAKWAGLEPVRQLHRYRCDTCRRSYYTEETLEPWICGMCEGGTMVPVAEEEI